MKGIKGRQPKNKPTDVFRQIDMKGGDKTQCWPWQGTYGFDRRGFPLPQFYVGGKCYVAYRMVLHLTDPTFNLDDPKDIARHKCDNKGVGPKESCCNPEHLTHGSHEQNMQDMVDRERHGMPKHTVRYIKKLLSELDENDQPMFTHAEIAKRFGVSRQTVTAINTGDRHEKVEVEAEERINAKRKEPPPENVRGYRDDGYRKTPWGPTVHSDGRSEEKRQEVERREGEASSDRESSE